MKELIGHGPTCPEQCIALRVVHGSQAAGELTHLPDSLLDHGAAVVQAPGRERVDARKFGEYVGRSVRTRGTAAMSLRIEA